MKKTINYLLGSIGIFSLLLVASCSEDDKSLPLIDGYNNSNEVAATNLKAHWTFDETNTEDISGTAPLVGDAGTFGTVGFEDGQIGKALKLTQGALVYPPIAALNTADALGNFTVSMWIKLRNNQGTAVEGYTILFGLFPETGGDFMWGNINMAAETSWFPGSGPLGDTLVLKGHFVIKNADGSINGQDNRPDPRGDPAAGVFERSGEWAHFVVRWNGSTHQLNVFGDATSIGAYNDRGTAGPLRMNVPCKPVFGNGATTAIGFESNPEQQAWSPMATASIDDVRVFNTALTDAEITALFNLGTAGR
ncbi:MAG: LamG domain-containing protein [Cyclobacteriaceae bacterium]|nr:LamG domain-containing protein [Cyclobacteriaceae bacterium]MDH4298089.1 LamG domain-containing protein [Cyclobacteriaceae bacterium]MDH5250813.1 LamG domain-containing protein [Cyclobacteriaceae bacterium]